MICPYCGENSYIFSTNVGDSDLGENTVIIITYRCQTAPNHKWYNYQTCEVKH